MGEVIPESGGRERDQKQPATVAKGVLDTALVQLSFLGSLHECSRLQPSTDISIFGLGY